MNDMLDNVAKTLAPIYNCTPLRAVREAMFTTVPIIVVGAMALILFQLPVRTLQQAVVNSGIVPHLDHVFTSTFQIAALVVAASIAASWARNKQLAAAPAAAIAVALMLINVPDFITTGEGEMVSGLDKAWLSGTGIANAIISGTITGAVYCPIMRMMCNKDEDVPSCTVAVYALVPALAVLTMGFVWFCICDVAFSTTPAELLYRICEAPFVLLKDGFGSALIYEFFKPLFWWLGIHGANVVGTVSDPIAEANLLENADIYQLFIDSGMGYSRTVAEMYDAGAHVYTSAFSNAFSIMGGVGITYGLCVSLIVFAKNTRLRILGIIGLGLSVFNINEPVLLCVVMLNPAMFIPFVLMPVISTTLAYGLTALGFLSFSTGVSVPWTTPAILSGMLAGGWTWAFLQLIVLTISCVVYTPFTMIADRLAYSEDHNGSLDGYGGRRKAGEAGATARGAGAPGGANGVGATGSPYGSGYAPGQPRQQAHGQASGQYPHGQVPGQPTYGQASGARPGASPNNQAVSPGAYGAGAGGSSQEFSGDFAGYDPITGRPIYK